MGKRGPKPRYASPEDLEAAINAYFQDCEEKDVFPDSAGMRVFLNLSQERLDQLCKQEYNPDNYKKYQAINARARDRRESWLARTATSTPKLAQGCMMALKQAANGGWVDKTEQAGGAAVNITIVGQSLESIGK